MDMSKVRGGVLIAAISGFVLLIALFFLDWYSVANLSVNTPFGHFSAGADLGAWDHEGFLGAVVNLVVLAAGIVAIGTALLTAGSGTVALPIASSAVTAGLGIASVVLILGRMVFQPGANGLVDLKFGIFLALISAVGVAYGGWQSMQEEGTTFEQARDQLQGRFPDAPQADRGAQEPPPPAPPPSD